MPFVALLPNPRRLLPALLLALAVSGCALPRLAVVDDPLSPQEHFDLGASYEAKGDYDLAIREYEKASRTVPQAYYNLGNVWYQKKDLDKAQTSYEKAVKRLPDDADVHNNLAWILLEKGQDLAKAEKLARRAVALDPDNPNNQDTLRQIQAARGQTRD